MASQSRKFGLIGFPLGHSYSKGHFSLKFEQEGLKNYSYENYEIPSIGLVRNILKDNPDLMGLNVTIPYKQAIIPFLDHLDPVAAKVGAVNTIRITRLAGFVEMTGFNTDVTGFSNSIDAWHLNDSISALIFGSGGSSLAIRNSLDRMGIQFQTVSRNPHGESIPYEGITEESARKDLLWINCTPVGMYPDINGLLPLPYQFLTDRHFLFDLVYNPEITGFLRMGARVGAHVMNGNKMLHEQAEASWKIWIEGLR